MHTGPMKDSDGDFQAWEDSKAPCRKCGGAVKCRAWESSCGGYEDYQYRCQSRECGHSWWVDGCDS